MTDEEAGRLLDQCMRKIAYPTLGEASRAVVRLFREKGYELSAYRCHLDGRHFHVGRLQAAKP